MRRKDREITHIHTILDLVSECKVCRLAMTDDGVPYIVPLNYGYEYADGALTFYFHSAKEGRKLEILKKNPTVCLELDGRGELVEDANPCAYGYTFASLIGTGNVEFIEDTEEKIYALNRIMKHQAGIEAPFTASMADAVCLYKMTTNDFTCKIRAK